MRELLRSFDSDERKGSDLLLDARAENPLVPDPLLRRELFLKYVPGLGSGSEPAFNWSVTVRSGPGHVAATHFTMSLEL